jgi:hypothetical protein
MINLRDVVFQALGEASMCWSQKPRGRFDSGYAARIGERVMAAIEQKDSVPPSSEAKAISIYEQKDMPNPTEEQLSDPVFNAIWDVIKHWDVNVPAYYQGYCGASGSHVMLIWNALKAIEGETHGKD